MELFDEKVNKEWVKYPLSPFLEVRRQHIWDTRQLGVRKPITARTGRYPGIPQEMLGRTQIPRTHMASLGPSGCSWRNFAGIGMLVQAQAAGQGQPAGGGEQHGEQQEYRDDKSSSSSESTTNSEDDHEKGGTADNPPPPRPLQGEWGTEPSICALPAHAPWRMGGAVKDPNGGRPPPPHPEASQGAKRQLFGMEKRIHIANCATPYPLGQLSMVEDHVQ